MKRSILIGLITVLLLSAALPISFAQNDEPTEGIFVLSEQQINDSWLVSNPRRQRIDNVSIDLKAPEDKLGTLYGYAIVNGEYLTRQQNYPFSFTYEPSIDQDGNIRWTHIGGVIEGLNVSDSTQALIDRNIEAWLGRAITKEYQEAREQVRNRTPRFFVTDLAINEFEMTITYQFTPIAPLNSTNGS